MGFMIRTNSDWRTFGRDDPYYGVLANDRFKAENMDVAAVEEFYASGVAHADKALSILDRLFTFKPLGTALDFGCGVGRLTTAFAARFDQVVGLDIAPGMLAHARSDALKRGITNVAYKNSAGEDGLQPETYYFVHSYIVLQHIATPIGEGILRDTIRATKTGGVGAIHFTYGYAHRPRWSALKNEIKKFRLLREFGNLVKGRRLNRPAMQMNCYSLPRIVEVFNNCGVDRFHMLRVDDWGNLGLFVFFEKTRTDQPGWSNPRP